jgi:hypothetical protein
MAAVGRFDPFTQHADIGSSRAEPALRRDKRQLPGRTASRLQSLPSELVDDAEVDGATRLRVARYIICRI